MASTFSVMSGVTAVIDDIIDKLEQEAEYQKCINKDVGLGMKYAIDIIRRELGGTYEGDKVGTVEEGTGTGEGDAVSGIQTH